MRASSAPASAFRDRADAGRLLAARLVRLRSERPVVLGLPRGGVPVAALVARALDAPLDVLLVRKLGVPGQPELAVGAVGEGGTRVVNEAVRREAGVGPDALAAVERAERRTLAHQAARFRVGPPVPLVGRTVVIVDDGIATGSTAAAACAVARARGATRVVVATPVAPPTSIARLSACADEVVCVRAPVPFFAIGQWYEDFRQTTDEEVLARLAASAGYGPEHGIYE